MDGLRGEIDRLDGELVRLLNERALIALRLAVLKKQAGLPVVAPQREAEVLRRVQRLNQGPLDGDSISQIYDRIFSETRKLQRGESAGTSVNASADYEL
jgi:chorismate mutase